MIQEDRIVKTLQELVKIPSHESMEKISKYVVNEVRKEGFLPEVDGDGNVVVRIGTGPAFLLNAHLDTVPPGSYDDPYSGNVINGKVFGRGATDCKAGVAAMLEIMRVIKDKPLNKQLILAFTVWEEKGDESQDGAYKVAKGINATHGLVLEDAVTEDSEMGAYLGCKGRFVYEIDVLGKPTHSGSPDQGENSIYLATKLIEKLKDLETSSVEVAGLEIKSYFSITQIEAKEGDNVIPGRTRLTADYRAIPGEKEEEIRERVESICKEVLDRRYTLKVTESRQGFVRDDQAFMDLCQGAVKEAGLKPKTKFSPGWNDATVFNDSDIIAFKMGPGTVGQDHRTPEYCWIQGLVKGSSAILNTIRKWDQT